MSLDGLPLTPQPAGPHADRWGVGMDPRPLDGQPLHDYTVHGQLPEGMCYCQVCGAAVTEIVQFWREPPTFEDELRRGPIDWVVGAPQDKFTGARLDPCGHHVRCYLIVTPPVAVHYTIQQPTHSDPLPGL